MATSVVAVQPKLFLSPRYTEDSQLLWRAALESGWDIQRVNWSVLPYLDRGEVSEKVIYGESIFAHSVASIYELILLEPSWKYTFYLPYWMTKRKLWIFSKVGGVWSECVDRTTNRVKRWEELKGPLFCKPSNKEGFAARIYKDPVEELKNVEDVRVIISEPVEWVVEFRSFVVEGRMRTISPYMRYGSLEMLDKENKTYEAARFIESVLANRVGAAVGIPFVLDVGEIEGRGWGVVEANPCWASGLLACDPCAVLEVLRTSAIKR